MLYREKWSTIRSSKFKNKSEILAAPQERFPYGPDQSLAKEENTRFDEATASKTKFFRFFQTVPGNKFQFRIQVFLRAPTSCVQDKLFCIGAKTQEAVFSQVLLPTRAKLKTAVS